MKKVLIVDDDKDFLWILRQSLSNQPFLVFYASGGEEGLRIAKKEKPDLVVVDILMPEMNGIAMANKLKEEGIQPEMIFLTNLKDADHISQAMDFSGNPDYIVKTDVGIDSVVKRIKSRLGVS